MFLSAMHSLILFNNHDLCLCQLYTHVSILIIIVCALHQPRSLICLFYFKTWYVSLFPLLFYSICLHIHTSLHSNNTNSLTLFKLYKHSFFLFLKKKNHSLTSYHFDQFIFTFKPTSLCLTWYHFIAPRLYGQLFEKS